MSSKLSRFKKNDGFSRAELLVVITCVGIIVFMLLPAAGTNQRQNRRISCLSKIRNITLACVVYESSNQQFPAVVSSHGESFLVRILPRLEQISYYDDFRSAPDKDLAKDVLAGLEIDTFRCDSTPLNDFDSAPLAGFTSHYTGCAGPASSNTADVYGSAEFSYQTNSFGPVGLKGFFSPTIINGADPSNAIARATKSGVITEHVSDGVSNTLAIVETSRSDLNSGGRTFTNHRSRWSWGLEENEPTKVNWARSITRTINSYNDMPNQKIPYHELPISSNHVGGANVSCGDGSTHFVSEDTDLIVLQALSGINEGDVAHQDLYGF